MNENMPIITFKKRKTRSDKGKKRKIKKKEYICDQCGHKTRIRSASLAHYLNCHATIKERNEQFKFFCDKCNFGSMSQVSYNTHLNTKKHKYIIQLLQ